MDASHRTYLPCIRYLRIFHVVNIVFVETAVFSRQRAMHLSDEDYLRLQATLLENPDAGTVIPDSGGLRKLRWRDARRGKGKRGGLRVIYYYWHPGAQIWFVTLYGKDRKDDMSARDRHYFREQILRVLRIKNE